MPNHIFQNTEETELIIRRENQKDYEKVYQLIKKTFESAEHKDGNEQDLAAALRKSSSFVPELALVAEINEKIAGHIMYSKADIGGKTVLVLAPLSVAPEYQQQGVGSGLVNESLKTAKKLGWEYVFVLGSEKYYPKFGFIPAERYGAATPDGIPAENFMAVKLYEEAGPLSGELIYAREFGI